MNNKVEEPALNWFISSLAEDVGSVTWVMMNTEEQSEFTKKTGSDYPLKAVKFPIKKGKKIVLDKGKVKIDCNSEKVRDYIIAMAIEYKVMEAKLRYLEREKRAEKWHPISDLPPHSMCSSRPDWYHCIVDSPILHYIGGVTLGVRKKGKWYIFVRGKEVEHPVTHYREIPPHAEETVPYESIKDEVQQLRYLFAK